MKSNAGLKLLGATSLGLLVVAIFNKVKKLNTADNLLFDITKVNIVGLDKLYVNLKISNPSKETVTFDYINTELYLNGINVGRIYYNKPLLIAQNSATEYVFPVILYPAGELQILSDIIQKKAKKGEFKMDGKVSINTIPVPFKKTFKAW